MILLDSSVLIGFLRGSTNAAIDRLDELLRQDARVAIPSLCAGEALQGAANEREWDSLHEYLRTQELLPLRDGPAQHFDAARIFFDCRRSGLTVRSTIDCLIAQQALDVDAVLLHDDDDFDRIARVRPLRAWRGE